MGPREGVKRTSRPPGKREKTDPTRPGESGAGKEAIGLPPQAGGSRPPPLGPPPDPLTTETSATTHPQTASRPVPAGISGAAVLGGVRSGVAQRAGNKRGQPVTPDPIREPPAPCKVTEAAGRGAGAPPTKVPFQALQKELVGPTPGLPGRFTTPRPWRKAANLPGAPGLTSPPVLAGRLGRVPRPEALRRSFTRALAQKKNILKTNENCF